MDIPPCTKVGSNLVIMQQIMKYCQVTDIKTFRMVSNDFLWYSKFEWKRATISIGAYPGWGNVCIKKLLEKFESMGENERFQNFTLIQCSLPTENSVLSAPETRFWEICAPKTKKLTIDVSCNYTSESLAYIISNLLPELRYLQISGIISRHKRIKLESVQWTAHNNLRKLCIFGQLPFENWSFLQHFPQLKEVEVSQCSNDGLIEDLGNLRRDGIHFPNIENLNFLNTDMRLFNLVDTGLRLKEVSIRVNYMRHYESRIRDVLASQIDSLQKLALLRFIKQPFSVVGDDFMTVNFKSLTQLTLFGKMSSNFDFLFHMPSLKSLVVDLYCFYSDIKNVCRTKDVMMNNWFLQITYSAKLSEHFIHNNLKALQIDFKFNEESILILTKWLPNITTYESIIEDNTIRVIYQRWPLLDRLVCMLGSEVSHNGLFGDNENLTSMRNLSSFKYFSLCDTSTLDDNTADGFAGIYNLSELEICVARKFSVSKEDSLKGHIVHFKIYRNYGKHSYQDLKCCQRRALLI